jgi:hypothetical protein
MRLLQLTRKQNLFRQRWKEAGDHQFKLKNTTPAVDMEAAVPHTGGEEAESAPVYLEKYYSSSRHGSSSTTHIMVWGPPVYIKKYDSS